MVLDDKRTRTSSGGERKTSSSSSSSSSNSSPTNTDARSRPAQRRMTTTTTVRSASASPARSSAAAEHPYQSVPIVVGGANHRVKKATKSTLPICLELYFWPNSIFIYPAADPRGITSREVYQKFQSSYDIFRGSGAKCCSDHRFRARTPSLHCPIANSASTQSQQPMNRTANQI